MGTPIWPSGRCSTWWKEDDGEGERGPEPATAAPSEEHDAARHLPDDVAPVPDSDRGPQPGKP